MTESTSPSACLPSVSGTRPAALPAAPAEWARRSAAAQPTDFSARFIENTLNDTAMQLSLALEAARLGYWHWCRRSDVVTFSERAREILGLQEQTVYTWAHTRELLHPEHRAVVEEALASAFRERGVFEAEVRFHRLTGEPGWLILNGQGIFADDGRLAGMRGMVKDITGRKDTEVHLQRRNELLTMLAETAQTLLAAQDIGALADELFQRISRCLDVDVFTHYAAEPSGEWMQLVACGGIDEECRQAFQRINFSQGVVGVVARTRQTVALQHVLERDDAMTVLARSQGVRCVICHPLLAGDRFLGTISFGSRGRDAFEPEEVEFMQTVATYVAMARERLRIEEERQEALRRERAASLAKDRFLAVLSHELRTPLTPVLMAAAAWEKDPAVPPAMREELAMVRRNVELETQLIDDLLDLSRVTSGKLTLKLQAAPLNELVQHVADICEPVFREKAICFTCTLAHEAGHIMVDSARFHQVLWNVMKNAAKFTPEHGEVFVNTSLPAAGRIRVSVRDTGIGIAPHLVARIFDAFEQGDAGTTHQYGGLGLGLAISRAVMELHQGSISVESAGRGLGATFHVELPTCVPTSAEPVAVAPSPAPASTAQLQLLLVEDHVDTARTLGRLLAARGFLVQTANSAGAALACLERETFDLVVSDIGLPDATGFELMQRIRVRFSVKAIAMSGYGMEEDVRQSREAGFSEHLVKPIDVAQLEQAIRRVVAG